MKPEEICKVLCELYTLREKNDDAIELIGAQDFGDSLTAEFQTLRNKLEEMDELLSKRIVLLVERMLKAEKLLEEWSS